MTKAQEPEFLPVIFKGKKDELPTDLAIKSVASGTFDASQMDANKPELVPIVVQKEKEEPTCYYMKPDDFEKYIVESKKRPENLAAINEEAMKNLLELKKVWLKFGASILAVHTLRSYRLECDTFEEFCDKKLKLHQSTVYEIMNTTLFLMQNRQEVYKKILDGSAKAEDSLPSYRALYLVSQKKKQLTKKGKFDELVDQLLKEKLSVNTVKDRLRDILVKGQDKKITRETVVKHYEKVCEELAQIKASKEILKAAKAILDKLKNGSSPLLVKNST
jgi:hypothetical protein